jgi:energy-coupling factor transporter ATP-binding protein EcfA2
MSRSSATPSSGGSVPVSAVVHLLDDSPAGQDDFEGQAHVSVARAIAALLTHETGGRVVGLEGPWGSGKSTIVRLIEGYFAEDSGGSDQGQPRLLVFDTWAHQGDPLRRTFLEKLLDVLVVWKWMDAKDADEQRGQLTGRSLNIHTTSKPRLTPQGIIASTAALLVPLGIALFDNTFRHNHGQLALLGLILTLAPFIFLFLMGAAIAVTSAVAKKRSLSGFWKRVSEAPVLSFFVRDEEKDETTESIEHGEPTSVEFERFFRTILSTTLLEGRQLVLVLDNLDRVNADDARELLATMQTFTGSGRGSSEPWSKRLWTLIPYDLDGLRRLWDGDEDDQSLVSDAFLDKLFEVRFDAPPLVLSDWRHYLFTQLTEALPSLDETTRNRLVRLRAQYAAGWPTGRIASEEPTPRQLKQFVNQIGAIWRQRQDLPILHVAYYCLLVRDGADVSTALSSDTTVPPRLRYLLSSPSLPEDLAAMYFGTSPALGQQLLLRSPLEAALTKRDVLEVQRLAGVSGFAEVLDAFDLESWSADGGSELSLNAGVLSDAGVLGDSSLQDWVADRLKPVILGTDGWVLSGRDTGRGLAVLVDLLSDDTERSLVLSHVGGVVSKAGADPNEGLQGLAALADGLIDTGQSIEKLRVTLDIPDDQLARALDYFRSQARHEESWKAVDLKAPAAKVAAALVTSATDGNHVSALHAITLLLPSPGRVDPKTIATGIANWLQAQDTTDATQLDVLLRILDVLPSVNSQSAVEGLADDGTLMHHFSQANSKGWLAGAAAASMLFLRVRPSTAEPAPAREAATGVQVLRDTLANPGTNPTLADTQGKWLGHHAGEAVELLRRQLAADPRNAPWVDAQLKTMFESKTLELSPEQFVATWEVLRRALGSEDFEALTGAELIDPNKRLTILPAIPDCRFALVTLKISVVGSPAEVARPEVLASSARLLQEASRDDWLEALNEPAGGPLVHLAIQLSASEARKETPPALDEALHEHAKRLQTGQPAWSPSGDEFARLTALLDSSVRGVLASGLCAGLEVLDGEINIAFFNVYGEFLTSEEQFRTHSKVPNVIQRLLERDNWESVGWFVKLAKTSRDTLATQGREEAFLSLTRKAFERLEAMGEDAPSQLKDMVELLGGAARSPDASAET